MTRPQLERLVAKWQPRLRLEDWTVTIRWATITERNDEDWLGICYPHITTKHADIVIVNPARLKSDDTKYHDVEVTVVHELLHLMLAPFRTKNGTLLEVAEENLVHIISTLLVALDRGDSSLTGKKLPRPAYITPRKRIATQKESACKAPTETGAEGADT